ncbi:MAG: NADPH2:quinone reductase [Verrucomicrobiales bacterium]|jgi:NADPH2:quinone reductase
MRAITVKPGAADAPGTFMVSERPKPEVLPDDICVRVHAVGVNPIDTKMRMSPPADDVVDRTLGWDAAGVIESVGSAASAWKPGDHVYYAGSILRPGANSEWHCVDGRLVGRMPASLSFADAAALPLTTLTAWEALFEHMHIGAIPFGLTDLPERQRTLLLIGGAGGVGSIAIQLARQVPDLTVIATASRDESRQWCEQMGAHHVIDHSHDLAQQLNDRALPAPDYVLINRQPDSYFDPVRELMAPFARVCSTVESGEPLDTVQLRGKAGSWSWQAMFARSNHKAPDMDTQGRILNQVGRWIDDGKLVTTRTTNYGELTPHNLAQAHQASESGTMIGKAVLDGIGIATS